MYRKSGIKGGHIILLNSVDSEYYEDTKEQAVMALEAYPQGLQVGGGITADNAMEFIDAGAAAVIVTSYVFKDGRINYANLNRLKDTVGSDRLVLDLSCRKKDGQYYIVTDRWQNFTDEAVTTELLDKLSSYCCEFLVHAVDLGSWGRIPVTYAGGVSSFDDLKCIRQLGQNHLNVTIGSALDLFGGEMEYDKVIAFCNNKEI
jgi:phosphoribosylformimino-5-aminoimidazole carboxamide ribotide isomerase